MKFLVDAHLPRRLAQQFRAFGHEALHTLDLPKGNRTPDAELGALSVRDHAIVVTKDADFVNTFTVQRVPSNMDTIASGSGVRERARRRRQYGQGRWRKRKGVARVRLVDSMLRLAEIHWYEAHGIGR